MKLDTAAGFTSSKCLDTHVCVDTVAVVASTDGRIIENDGCSKARNTPALGQGITVTSSNSILERNECLALVYSSIDINRQTEDGTLYEDCRRRIGARALRRGKSWVTREDYHHD